MTKGKRHTNWVKSKQAQRRTYPGHTKRHAVAGYIYVFKLHPNENLYKIGRSVNIEQRLAGFKKSNPFIVCQIVRRVEDAAKIERALHKKHRARRVGGEIFKLDKIHLERIDTYLAKRQMAVQEIPQVGTTAPRPEQPT